MRFEQKSHKLPAFLKSFKFTYWDYSAHHMIPPFSINKTICGEEGMSDLHFGPTLIFRKPESLQPTLVFKPFHLLASLDG